MNCTNCGMENIEGRFCPNCGLPLSSSIADPYLPEGISCGENGVIRWEWKEKETTWYFMMDERKISYETVIAPKEETPGAGLKEFVKDTAALALDIASIDKNYYNGQFLSSGSSESGDRNYLMFSDVRKIKGIPEKNMIKIKAILTTICIYVADHQYSFVFDYVVRHAPNAVCK